MEQLLFNDHNFLSSSEAGGPKLNTARQTIHLNEGKEGRHKKIKLHASMSALHPDLSSISKLEQWRLTALLEYLTPSACSIRVVCNSLILAH